jgi:hypothetical protein
MAATATPQAASDVTATRQAATASHPATRAAKREAPQYVYFRRPRCPNCGGVRLMAYATKAGGDGSTARYCKCDGCNARLILVVE